jgi:hypothetical protein
MSSILVIIPDVLVHQAFQMPFVENDHMVSFRQGCVTPFS